ncbi:MAG: SAM-dependent methyltransferase [Sediminibacterium sp.]|nr:MAG: SAM-dependent methyltransferase [Sediminibacterium sp.] [Sediminibacterium sp. FEMGT703S]
MNTKTFAQQSRVLLMEGVANKLMYWGFSADDSNSEQPKPVAGGYIFRGKVFDDETVPKLWNSLDQAIKTKGIDVVKEEAAYTWFNRMMALQIMAKNDYLDPQLAYVPGMANTPQILQKARQGQYSFLNSNEQERLKRIITDFSKEQEAFAILLVGYCHNNVMLNNVFGKLDDYTELLLPDNMLQNSGFLHLLNTTDAITDEQYKEVELIGWLYQFYISERKDEVFASFKKKEKAEAKDIPAATQIFTPNWIVKYMVQNTVGKIWLDKNPNSKIKSSLKYLVENESDSTSEPIISEVSQLTLIDPAVGSGHILVEGFDLLYQMYMEEYYTPEEAVESILKNNLFGLDLDDRAAQLATFAILLKAAKQYRDVFAKGWLPNVYAMPEFAAFSDQEIKDFLGSNGTTYEKELELALSLMEQSKNLGSVMKLSLSDAARTFIEKQFTYLKNTDFRDINSEIVYQKIKTFIPVLLILSKKYTSVVANPPYMGQINMNVELKDYVNLHYPETKSDLMTVFMEVIPNMTMDKSRFALINLPSWLFLSSFEKLRKSYVDNYHFDSLLHMGRGIFGIDFGSVAFSMKKDQKENAFGSYFRLHERNFQHILFQDIEKLFLYSNGNVEYKYDFRQYRGEEGITQIPKEGTFNGQTVYYPKVLQSNFEIIPGSPIAYWISNKRLSTFKDFPAVLDIAEPKVGMLTTNNDLFMRSFWEVSQYKIGFNLKDKTEAINKGSKWIPYSKGGSYRKWYGNNEFVVNFENDGQTICNYIDSQPNVKVKSSGRVTNRIYFYRPALTWSLTSSGSFGIRYRPQGFIFDIAGMSIFNESKEIELKLAAFLNSSVAFGYLSLLNPTLSFQKGDLEKIPANLPELKLELVEHNILLSKNDWDSREISWDFKQNPLLSQSSSITESYLKWYKNVKENFFQLLQNEEELNKIFIETYEFHDEVSPEVLLKDITILQDELKKNDLEVLEEKFRAHGKDAIELPINRGEVISQFISYAIGLFMGRYRLDKSGLNIAHPNPSKEELASYTYNHGEVLIDQDAILPIMGKNCNFNDDVVKQFSQLLDIIWGHEQRTENINFIQECLDKELDKFIVSDFWSYHCGMYKKTPIYWLFSSKKGAFQVLVYMHRMNEFTVEKIRANYLLEHLKYLKSEIAQKEANASNLSTAEAKQLDKLRADLIECEQYDLALKNVADQQIKFDLDDGVAKNYKLFETVVAKIK